MRKKTGKQLDQAVKIRETFTDRPHTSVRRMGWDWPKTMISIGTCEAILYRSDKWQKDGKEIDYKHVAEGPQELLVGDVLFEGAPSDIKAENVRMNDWPDSFAILAKSLGVQSKLRTRDGRYVEMRFPKGSMLGAGKFKDGSVFCFVFNFSGVLALVQGEKLDVLKDGIVG